MEPTEEPAPITWDTFGAGIYFEGAGNSLVIDKSGVDNNVSPSNGAGLYIASGTATITNSTISSNVAGGDAGGIYNAGESTLTHVTIVHNLAENTGGLIDSTTLLLYNSILADNDGGDCSGTLNGTIGNLIRDLSCNHDGHSDDPNLLLLGGSPAYYLPQTGSPALDAASPDYCLLTDQRGIDRTPDACDIGAAEHQPAYSNSRSRARWLCYPSRIPAPQLKRPRQRRRKSRRPSQRRCRPAAKDCPPTSPSRPPVALNAIRRTLPASATKS